MKYHKSYHSANLGSYNVAQLYTEDPRPIPKATVQFSNLDKF